MIPPVPKLFIDFKFCEMRMKSQATKLQHYNLDPSQRGCELFRALAVNVAFCSAKVAPRDAAFVERKATMRKAQPPSDSGTLKPEFDNWFNGQSLVDCPTENRADRE
jgi:hypothetical protein